MVTIGAQANILAIHDKLVRLIAKEQSLQGSVNTHVLLQDAGPESLGWSNEALETFLNQQVHAKFGVVILRKHIRPAINGTSPTIGDLSIAIATAIQRQHRPRKSLAT